MQEFGQSKRQVGGEITRDALGIPTTKRIPTGETPFSLAYETDHHSRRCVHANAPNERSRVGLECYSATLGSRSVRGKMITSADPHHHLPIINMGLTPQEGKNSQLSSQ